MIRDFATHPITRVEALAVLHRLYWLAEMQVSAPNDIDAYVMQGMLDLVRLASPDLFRTAFAHIGCDT